MKIYSSWVSLGSLFWLWLPSFLLKVGLSRLSVYSRKLQIVELEHVFTHDLSKNIRRQMAQLLGNDFPRMTNKVLVPFMNVERHPSNLVLDIDKFEAGESLHDPAEYQIEQRVGRVVQLRINGSAIGVESFPFIPAVIESGEYVQVDWHVQILRGFPEGIVMVADKGKMRRRNLPDQAAYETFFLAALELLDRVFDVVERNYRNSDQAIRVHLTVGDQPVVGDLKTSLLQLGILKREQTKSQRRVKHFSRDAVHFHLFNARSRIPAARFFSQSFSRRIFGILILQRCGQIFHPQIVRLHDM